MNNKETIGALINPAVIPVRQRASKPTRVPHSKLKCFDFVLS